MKNKDNNTLVIILVTVLVLTLFSGIGGMMGYGFMGPGMMYGYYGTTGFGFMWIFMLVYLAALVLLIFWLIKQIQK